MANKAQNSKIGYPKDWPAIAYQIKQQRRWQCQICGIYHGEDPHNNITVHHKDYDTFNNDPDNLEVLCQICHLRVQNSQRRARNYHREINRSLSLGQRILPGFYPTLFQQQNIAPLVAPTHSEEPATRASTETL